MERLLVSRSGKKNGFTQTAVFFMAACCFLFTAWLRWRDSANLKEAGYSLIIAAGFFIALKYEKLIYISREGFVKETHTWFTHHREILRWDEVRFITLMYRRRDLMLFAERDTLGWKVPFELSQAGEVKALLERYIPEVEVNEIRP
jgi:hypothetical protein